MSSWMSAADLKKKPALGFRIVSMMTGFSSVKKSNVEADRGSWEELFHVMIGERVRVCLWEYDVNHDVGSFVP